MAILSTRTSFLLTALFILGTATIARSTEELQSFPECRLVEASDLNDGDSFLVDLGDKTVLLRLYFVDCPEQRVTAESEIRRVQEQRRYFGLPDERLVIFHGEEASEFTRSLLDEPFTVHTAFASAPGRSAQGRIYGFVTTADGKDLGSQLVRHGLARVHGVGRQGPHGQHRDKIREKLEDLALAATHDNRGVWADTEADLLTSLRALQREEEDSLRRLRDELLGIADIEYPLDLNLCATQELESIRGIGPILAERIVAARPYQDLSDLKRVEGIGSNRLQDWQNLLTVGATTIPASIP